MAPAMENNSYITRFAAITGGDAGNAISLSMAICQPGEGPYMHMHMHTDETFLVLYGKFAIIWGEHGEHRVEVGQYDLISVPAGVLRTFENIGDEPAALFVVIQGDKKEFNDVSFTPALAESIAEKYGEDTLAQLKANGRNFTAGV
jgi:mannose-6-phosphate isomerase-like protein (cupin superfamily)